MKKAFFIIFLAGAAVCGLMLFQLNTLLNSQEPFVPMTTLTPQEVDLKFGDADALLGTFTLITTVALFAISFIIAIQKKTSAGIYFLLSAVFFILFKLIDDLYFDDWFFAFRKSHKLWEGGFSAVGIFGIVFCLIVAAAAFFSYLAMRSFAKGRKVAVARDPSIVTISSQSERPS
jgi:hypothetical protein